MCSYWLQRAHYDAVISVKYTDRPTSLCHNFCVQPPSQPNCGIRVTGSELFWKATLCGVLSEKVCARWQQLLPGLDTRAVAQLANLTQLNFTVSYPRPKLLILSLVSLSFGCNEWGAGAVNKLFRQWFQYQAPAVWHSKLIGAVVHHIGTATAYLANWYGGRHSANFMLVTHSTPTTHLQVSSLDCDFCGATKLFPSHERLWHLCSIWEISYPATS